MNSEVIFRSKDQKSRTLGTEYVEIGFFRAHFCEKWMDLQQTNTRI